MLPCCLRFNWNGHRGMLPCAALRGKLVHSTGGTDCTRAAVEFDPCQYSLPLIQIVNKLITNIIIHSKYFPDSDWLKAYV